MAVATDIRGVAKRRGQSWNAIRRFAEKRPLGAGGAAVLAIFILGALTVQTLSPYGVDQTNYEAVLQAPSSGHLMGTDQLGRDIFTRVLYGARLSLAVGLAVALGSSAIGLLLGVVSGYYGRWVDRVLIVFLDAAMAFPTLILALALIAALGPSLQNVVIALILPSATRAARIVRANVLQVRSMQYVEAARALGSGAPRMMLVHIAPNVVPTLLVLTSLTFAGAILAESSLSFLGLGPPPPTPTWGRMLSDEGRQYFRSAPWIMIWTGAALTMAVYAINLLGDSLRDHLDPRLRGS